MEFIEILTLLDPKLLFLIQDLSHQIAVKFRFKIAFLPFQNFPPAHHPTYNPAYFQGVKEHIPVIPGASHFSSIPGHNLTQPLPRATHSTIAPVDQVEHLGYINHPEPPHPTHHNLDHVEHLGYINHPEPPHPTHHNLDHVEHLGYINHPEPPHPTHKKEFLKSSNQNFFPQGYNRSPAPELVNSPARSSHRTSTTRELSKPKSGDELGTILAEISISLGKLHKIRERFTSTPDFDPSEVRRLLSSKEELSKEDLEQAFLKFGVQPSKEELKLLKKQISGGQKKVRPKALFYTVLGDKYDSVQGISGSVSFY